MPLPTASQVHIDAALTNISVMHMQSPSSFVYDKVFPVVPVQKQSDKYFIFDRSDTFRDASQKRAPGTKAARIGMRLSNDAYFCDEFALAQEIPDQVRNNADPSVDVERASTITVTQNMMIGAETNWVSNYFTTGKWGTDYTGGSSFTKWDNFSGSDPQSDISEARVTVKKNTGYDPNTMVVAYEVNEVLKRHPLVKEQFKYTSADSISEQMLARFFNVDRYLVAGGVKTTSAEGAESATFDFIAGDGCLLAYVPSAPGIMVPAAGYTFVWAGYTGLNSMGLAVQNYRVTERKVDVIEGTFCYDQKLVTAAMGGFFSDCIG